MICNNCSLRSICKIFDMTNNPGVIIELKNCEYKKAPDAASALDNTAINKTTGTMPQERKSRAHQDITELSNKLKAEKEAEARKQMMKNQPKVNIIETKEGEETECASCKTMTTSIFNCPICKKEICLCCSMTSMDINGGILNLCEECWSTDAEKVATEKEEEKTAVKKAVVKTKRTVRASK